MHTLISRAALLAAALLAAAVVVPSVALAQQQGTVGYTPVSAARERDIEADAIRRPSPASASGLSQALSREVHVSGTPAQARTRDYVVAQMKSWGLETEVRGYDIWMPHPTEVGVWRVSPTAMKLSLAEPPVPNDPTSAL